MVAADDFDRCERSCSLRPAALGYSFDEARAFLVALRPEGAVFYRNVQQRLDLVYLVLLAATLFFSIAALLPRRFGGWRWLIAVIGILGSVFDYLENVAVMAMLEAGPGGLTPALVATANRWTVLKSDILTGVTVLLLVLIALRVVGRLRRRSDAASVARICG